MTIFCYLLGAYLIYLLLVALHELGHLMACFWFKLGWREFQVGPFALERRGQETHLVYSPRWFGGQVKYVLRPGRILTLRESIIFLLAGCSTNLALSAALIFIFCRMSPRDEDTCWPILLAGCLSFFMAFENLYPHKRREFQSDGSQMLQLWRSRRRNNTIEKTNASSGDS